MSRIETLEENAEDKSLTELTVQAFSKLDMNVEMKLHDIERRV